MIRFLLISLCLVFTGCASSGLKSSSGSGSRDLKSQEYEALKADVSAFHESSTFGADKPWLFTSKTSETFPQEFARTRCANGGIFRTTEEANACARLFNHVAFDILSQQYFAADPAAIGRKCQTDLLVCNDLMALEALFRNLHNASIQDSKQEKLASLEEWHEGKLTDDELKAVLHLDFKVQNGKLIVSLPSNSAPAERTVVGSGS